MVDHRKICSKCGRARKGHESPFGKNCTLTPLSEAEKAKVVSQLEAEEKQEQENHDEQVRLLLKQKAELEAQAKKTREAIEEEELLAAELQKEEEIKAIKEEMERLRIALEDEQAKLVNLKTKNDEKRSGIEPKTPEPTPVPTTTVPAAPPAANPVLDPAMQIYAQAAAVPTAGATGSAGGLGATAMQLMQENPLLALACGIQKDNVGAKASGKCVAEDYAFKDSGRSSLRYNEFIHGAIRLMLKRVKENKPIKEYLVHYERMAGFALQYRWGAVRKYHNWISEQVQEGERDWDSPIEVMDSIRFLKHEASLLGKEEDEEDDSDREQEKPDKPAIKRGRPQKRDHRPRPPQFREYRAESEGGRSRGICRLYNWDRWGCTYGSYCQFDHDCATCFQYGIRRGHRAMDCQRGSSHQAPVNHFAAPAQNGQAGGVAPGGVGGAGR